MEPITHLIETEENDGNASINRLLYDKACCLRPYLYSKQLFSRLIQCFFFIRIKKNSFRLKIKIC